MTSKLSSFPHLSTPEFESACTSLLHSFNQHSHLQHDWISAELIHQHESKYLRITRPLPSPSTTAVSEVPEMEEENDDEALQAPFPTAQAVVQYDILLSPTYRVPALYVSIKDTLHRYPPTMDTLYRHIIPPVFQSQTKDVGVLGGITITDHPITNSPEFFVHPCQTAAVMEASAAGRDVTAEEYLLLWIGSLGKCVGLNVPIELVIREKGKG